MKLSPRLETIAGFVKKGDSVADIGTDHGYIPVKLIKEGISSKVVASDINKGPLNRAKEYVAKNDLEGKIETRLGGGLATVEKNEVDTAIIAGMGGMLISEILEASKEVAKSIERFVLQPMVGMVELRKYLYKNGYRVMSEKLAREGEKFYQILLIEHGKEDAIDDEIYFEFSKKLIENGDPLLLEFLEHKLKKLDKILCGISEDASGRSLEKKLEIEQRREALMEVCRNAVK